MGVNYRHDVFENHTYQALIKTFVIGMNWEETRFLLEVKHGLVTSKNGYYEPNMSYFVAYFYRGHTSWRNEADLVPPHHRLHTQDRIILLRLPYHQKTPYIPARFKSMFENCMAHALSSHVFLSEQIKQLSQELHLKDLMSQQMDLSEEEELKLIGDDVKHNQPITHSLHPAEKLFYHPHNSSTSQVKKTPPRHYTCHRCGEKGHFIQDCQTHQNPQFKPMYARKEPSCIPKSQLTEIDQPMAGAIQRPNGKWYILKHLVTPLQPEILVE
jgi:hypothetical protein